MWRGCAATSCRSGSPGLAEIVLARLALRAEVATLGERVLILEDRPGVVAFGPPVPAHLDAILCDTPFLGGTSWMNLVERFFADLTADVIRAGSFGSVTGSTICFLSLYRVRHPACLSLRRTAAGSLQCWRTRLP